LNEHWFQTLAQARAAIATWRQDFNEVRPHSSLGRIPPARFAEQHRQQAGDAAKRSITEQPDRLTFQPGFPTFDWHGGREQVRQQVSAGHLHRDHGLSVCAVDFWIEQAGEHHTLSPDPLSQAAPESRKATSTPLTSRSAPV